MIPKNITHEHILQANQEIDRNGVPPNREARKFTLLFKGKNYPPKYAVALANKFVNGILLDPEVFGGGKETNNFLRRKGFEILHFSSGYLPTPIKVKKIEGNPAQMTEHNERCKQCKETIRRMLEKLYGRVEINKRFELGVTPEDFKRSPFYPYLIKIFQSLQEFRGYKTFVFARRLPGLDYFVPSPGFIVEFDESQHFTKCRKIALQHYPQDIKLGFDKDKWIELCNSSNLTCFGSNFYCI